ncbi:hypothetical protein DXG01_008606 [Tephrocybe rancida]|nr:hypothetical protein DXG01_008606 [Tephrocybe rancida]
MALHRGEEREPSRFELHRNDIKRLDTRINPTDNQDNTTLPTSLATDTTSANTPTSTTDTGVSTSGSSASNIPSSTIDSGPSQSGVETSAVPTGTNSVGQGIPTSSNAPSASEGKKKGPAGVLVAGVLVGTLAFLVLLTVFFLWWWRRRRLRLRSQETDAIPFIPDHPDARRPNKRERAEQASDEKVEARIRQISESLPTLDFRRDLERGDPVGTMGTAGTSVQEEVTLLRERLFALEDQHRELSDGLRSAVIIPPQYSSDVGHSG